jgi:leader peptidase (prepilin peptidase)/N-methyltransferase
LSSAVKIATARFRGWQFCDVRLHTTVLSLSHRGTNNGHGKCYGRDPDGSTSTDVHRHDRISCASDNDCATSLTASRAEPSPRTLRCRQDSDGIAAPEVRREASFVMTPQVKSTRTAALRSLLTLSLLLGGYALVAAPVLLGTPALPQSDIAAGLVLAAFLVALTLIDVHSLRLPDALTVPLAALGVVIAHVLDWEFWSYRLLAVVAGFLFLFVVREVYARLRGRHGLGLGDAKLLAASAAWTGLAGVFSVLLWACFLAAAAVLLMAMIGTAVDRRLTGQTVIPFGPFLAAGTWLVWLYGPLL